MSDESKLDRASLQARIETLRDRAADAGELGILARLDGLECYLGLSLGELMELDETME